MASSITVQLFGSLLLDYILAVNHVSLAVLTSIDLKMKKGSIGDPDFYLGVQFGTNHTHTGLLLGMTKIRIYLDSNYCSTFCTAIQDH